jgi:hypothetical protein
MSPVYKKNESRNASFIKDEWNKRLMKRFFFYTIFFYFAPVEPFLNQK